MRIADILQQPEQHTLPSCARELRQPGPVFQIQILAPVFSE